MSRPLPKPAHRKSYGTYALCEHACIIDIRAIHAYKKINIYIYIYIRACEQQQEACKHDRAMNTLVHDLSLVGKITCAYV